MSAKNREDVDGLDRQARDRQLFDEIAAAYCQKDLAPASRLARETRLIQTLKAAPLPDDASVLEVGCGAGFAAEYLQGRVASYLGIDYSANLIDYARRHNRRPGVEFEVSSIEDFDSPRRFDAILMVGLLHHLSDVQAALRKMVGFLKPGGYLLANEPHSGNPLISMCRRVRKKIDRSYSIDQEEMSARQCKELLENAGFSNVRIHPQGVFSTPFAEVVLGPQWLTTPLAAVACRLDIVLEQLLGRLLSRVSWNLIVGGKVDSGCELPD